ncbi:MAG: EAL domain-containing protein [bacterium]
MHEKIEVLVIDADANMTLQLKTALEYKGYIVFISSTINNARGIITKYSPHLIVFDIAIKGEDGFAFLRELKTNIMFQHIPVLILSEQNELEDRVNGLEGGADDYVGKPFDLAELLARVGTIIKRHYYSLDANPLTRLPGNLSIMRTIETRLSEKKLVAITYFDLDYFKAFNDVYGFSNGDDVIRHTSRIILSAVHDFGNPDDFVGHIGGDDFIAISTPEKIDVICLDALQKFDATIINFYSHDDQEKGRIIIEDRRGKIKEFPIMSISAATVTNEYKSIKHIGQISAIATELKKYAKSFKGSCYVKDRRDNVQGGSALVYGGKSNSPDEVSETREEEVGYLEELDKILMDRALSILFQPIMNVSDETIIGHEGFCRGPVGSYLEQPQNLFRLARKIDKVKLLDQIAREKVISVARELKEELLLFINVLPESLSDPEFRSDKFLRHIDREPGSIVFEISGIDTSLSFSQHLKAMRFFQEKGFKIAIDNVGAGKVLGLGMIAEIKPSFVKLDISLMRGIDKDSVKQQTLRALLAVFKQLNIDVIAEKVEYKDELDFLVSLGICYVQGYLFAKPERIDKDSSS